MEYTVYLSGGANRQKFAHFKNKEELKKNIQTIYPLITFPTKGKVDYIVIPDDVKKPSDSAMRRSDQDTEIVHWSTFANNFHIPFEPQPSKILKSSKKTEKKSKKKSSEKSSKKKSSEKSSKKQKSSKKSSVNIIKTSIQPNSYFRKKKLIWKTIQDLNWTKDYNLNRVQKEMKKWSVKWHEEVSFFVFEKVEHLLILYKNFFKDKDPSNLFAAIVSLGESTYEQSLDLKQMKLFAQTLQPKDNFEYAFDI